MGVVAASSTFILLCCIIVSLQLDMSNDQVDKDGATCLQDDTDTTTCSAVDDSSDQQTGEHSETVPTKPTKETEACKVKQKDSTSKNKDERRLSFPKTIQGFGYDFIDNELRNIETQDKFAFEVRKGDKEYNQKHYEALGEVITEEIYKLLETRGSLKRIPIPLGKKPKETGSFIFVSPNIESDPDNLMILIHGSGVVRAGQWSRRLIINDNLDSGTQLPYIKRASESGYGVIVMNTNRNEEVLDGKKLKIKGSERPEEHGQYVWKNFVLKTKAKNIYIVAHSYGGIVTVEVMKKYFDDFKKRVKKIAFTDSVHNLQLHNIKSTNRRWISANARNWVTSPEPLDTEVKTKHGDVPRVSAGTIKHEETSFFAFESVFKYFSE